MKVELFPNREISAKARDLVEFDIASIRQVVSGAHARDPELWLAAIDRYERGGRILRDSEAPRLLGYSTEDHTLYVTDGCNSCTHRLVVDLESLTPEAVASFAQESTIERPLLDRLIAILSVSHPRGGSTG